MTQATETSLDINSLLAGAPEQLQHLLCSCYAGKATGSLSPQQLAERIESGAISVEHSLLVSLQLQLAQDAALSHETYAMAAFVDQLFNNYHKNNHLHPDIQRSLDQFRLPALLSLCRGLLPWLDKHSSLKYLRFIVPAVCGWHPEMGRAAEKFKQKISGLTQRLANCWDEQDAKEITNELQQFLEAEHQRVGKLEKRLRDAEIGQLHARHAQELSAKTLNQQMGGKKLPLSISRFLQGPWRESMRLTILSHGKESEQWRRIVRLTETLIWTFQPVGDDASGEQRQHIYDSISELSEQLRETVVGLHHSSELDTELAQVEQQHLLILKQQNLDYAPFELINNTDPLLSANVSISNNLIKNVSKINEGQWFIYTSDGIENRIKLTIKIEQVQQLLFTNFLGIKVEQFSYEEFAYMLSSKIAVPLGQRDILKVMGEKMLQSLLAHFHRDTGDEPADATVEQDILRQQENSRRIAREKALLEAKAHAEVARLRSQSTAKPESAPAANTPSAPEPSANPTGSAPPVGAIVAQLDKLLLGARLAFKVGDEEKTCRLAAILQTTGAYIFVNKDGIKEYSLSREQLGEMLAKGELRIIDQGSDSSSALEQVVNNFRNRKQP